MPEPTLFLFDGYNLLHAGPFAQPAELVDLLASFVAVRGARGIVVFDGVGESRTVGPLQVRYAPHADTVLERLAAEHRAHEHVLLVTSDSTLAGTAGREVTKLSSRTFFRDLPPTTSSGERRHGLADNLDADTRAQLERLRRGE